MSRFRTSNISSIQHYINSSNGFIWSVEKESFIDFFVALKLSQNNSLKSVALNAHAMANQFTYKNYCDDLNNKIFNN